MNKLNVKMNKQAFYSYVLISFSQLYYIQPFTNSSIFL